MNFLIQAYACSPESGGEFGVSWGWITHLNSKLDDNDWIYVLSLTLKERDIQNYNLKHVRLINVTEMKRFKILINTPIYFFIWQRKAYFTACRTNIKFDIIHVYSLSDFRQPGLWYKFKNSYTIFGPVGGGQICPASLRAYDTLFGALRTLINIFFKLSPFFKSRVNYFDKVYVSNAETANYFNSSEVLIDVPLNDRYQNLSVYPKINEKKIVLFCGRLINKKGVLLLLDALQIMDNIININYEVHIYGDGKQRKKIVKKIEKLHLSQNVKLKGKLPYDKIDVAYKNADVFVLPSLRESGGNVLVEAMAHALPIVSLDISFSHVLKEYNAGIFVETHQTRDKVVKSFSKSIITLLENPELCYKLGMNGYNFVNSTLSWDQMIKKVYKL